MLDDAGFGSSSAFGDPVRHRAPSGSRPGGLKYIRFHTTALCSPTRQALLTGRNHHSVGMGGITEIASGSPRYSSVLPNTASPIALTLKLNGYSTAQFGKCHEVPVWETSPVGPFDAWPTGSGGFEYFYGFIGGEAHQWYPTLYEGTTPVEVKKTPEEGYHFMEDMTDVSEFQRGGLVPAYQECPAESSSQLSAVVRGVAGWGSIPLRTITRTAAVPIVVALPLIKFAIARPAVAPLATIAGKLAVHIADVADTTTDISQRSSAPASISAATIGCQRISVSFYMRASAQIRSWGNTLGVYRRGRKSQ
jgi:Sulfatase